MTLKLLWIPVAFLSGALPLSLWIGRLAGVDIRAAGDGNPGATNVLRAAGRGWAVAALCADVSKAAVPVGLAYQIFGWHDWTIVPIALSPALGHAFSPFLGGRGGKALATMLGAWIGLTLIELPLLILIVLTAAFLVIDVDGWSVLLTALTTAAYLLAFHPDPLLLGVIGGQIALILWTQRADLRRRPGLKPRWRRGRKPAGEE